MYEIRVQEAAPLEMFHCPDGVWDRRGVRSDIRIHVIVRQQSMGAHTSAETLHSKLEINMKSGSKDLPLRAYARKPKPFLELVKGYLPIFMFFFVGARWR